MPKIGDRVGAIQSANGVTVKLFGYGVYQGDRVPPDDVLGPFGHMALYGAKNPCIKLDSGDEVWGCECWWGPEEKVRSSILGRAIDIVKPSNRRMPTDEERHEAAKLMDEVRREIEPIINQMNEGLDA